MSRKRRIQAGVAGIGVSIVTGTLIALAPHPWLWALLVSGLLLTMWGFWFSVRPVLKGSEPVEDTTAVDNTGGAFAGRDNLGIQQTFLGPVTYNHPAPPFVWGKTEKKTAEHQAIAARFDAERRLLAKQRAAPSYPDWKIREAFFHFDPNVLDNNGWEIVGCRLLDLLSSHQAKAWGRARGLLGGFSPLSPIRADFWPTALLTYEFFVPEHDSRPHAVAQIALGNIREEYADVRFNRAELEAAWQRSL